MLSVPNGDIKLQGSTYHKGVVEYQKGIGRIGDGRVHTCASQDAAAARTWTTCAGMTDNGALVLSAYERCVADFCERCFSLYGFHSMVGGTD